MMRIQSACDALIKEMRLQVRYSNQERVVEVHAVGYSRKDEAIMRAWQVRGGSSAGDPVGWKLFKLEDISEYQILDEKSEAPRGGYRRGDPAMKKIVREL